MARTLADHTRLEEWARGASPLHRADPRAKVLALLVLLVCIATTPPARWLSYTAYTLLLLSFCGVSRVSLLELMRRLLFVLPFPALFALLHWLVNGDAVFAASLLWRAGLSSLAVLGTLAVTPVPQFLSALGALGLPDLLVAMTRLLLRYLTLIAEQGLRMRQAAACRSLGRPAAAALLRRGGGALGVLFINSYERAEAVHWAMLARGYRGQERALGLPPLRAAALWVPALFALAGGVIRYV